MGTSRANDQSLGDSVEILPEGISELHEERVRETMRSMSNHPTRLHGLGSPKANAQPLGDSVVVIPEHRIAEKREEELRDTMRSIAGMSNNPMSPNRHKK